MYLSSSNIFHKDESINASLQIPPLLNFDFNRSIPVLSPDNSFVIFYTDSILLNVDLKTKKVKWFQKFENYEKISDVQITPMNQITFVKKLDTHNEIVVLSNSNCMEYNELKLKDNILYYKFFQSANSNDSSDLILIVNDYFQISLYKDNIFQRSGSRNLLDDTQNQLFIHKNQILTIEYLPEQQLILLFFDNGIILIYSISNYNPENLNSNEEMLEYENYINLNRDEDNQYLYYNFKILKNDYICDNANHNHNHNNRNMDIEIDNSDKNSSLDNNDNNHITTFLTISANQKTFNKRKSSLYFFKLENGKFISLYNDNDENNVILSNNNIISNSNNINNNANNNNNYNINNLDYNKISFDNKEIVDLSIFKYKINNDENDMSEYIFILFKNFNNFNNNKFLYSTEYSNLFHWINLDKEKNGNKDKFEIFEVFEELMNSYIYINNINLTQKNPRIFTVNYIKLGENIISVERNNENFNANNKNMKELLSSSNYNDYLNQMNSINFNEEEFNNTIIEKYKHSYDMDLEEELFKIKNGQDDINFDDGNKLNYFLLNLMANQSLFKIKSYLLKRNALNSGYLFPIEQICLTCKFLLKCIKNKLKANQGDNDANIEKLLSILIEILKIVQNRNRAYNDKLFGGEKEIMIEQESDINSDIFDAECLLFISKIQKLYNNYNYNNGIEQANNGNSFFDIFSFKKEENKKDNNGNDDENDIELEDNFNSGNKALDKIKDLHMIYFDFFGDKKLKNLFSPKTEYPITLNALLYYIKFVIFNHYFYCVFPKIINNELNMIEITEKDLSQNDFFKKILPELKNYFEISKALYILDNSEGEESNVDILNLIKFLQYISSEKLIMNKQINEILPMNKIIFNMIKCLYDKKYFYEALSIGNSLFSYLSNFDEFIIYLYTILQLKDYPLAYSFINNCLLLYYKIDDEKDEKIKKFLESDVYFEIKNMYINFYRFLIENKAIDFLFKLPLNFIEIYIFKEMCEENEKYKELLIIYYIMVGNVKEAKYCFQKYLNSNGVNESQSKVLYANLIKYYEILFNRKPKDEEKIDEIIEKLSTENKFLLKIDDEEEKRIINNKINVNNKQYIDFSDSILRSSILENNMISNMNYNANDYNKISNDLMNKLSSSYNKNLSSNFLSKENIKKKIELNNIKPFDNVQLSSIHYKNTNSNYNNIISNE